MPINWYGFYRYLSMTFKQFRYLSEEDQEALLWRKGVELARYNNKVYHFILYQVDGFYMEVKYKMPQCMLLEIACFEDVNLLQPYLRKIDIDSLFAA